MFAVKDSTLAAEPVLQELLVEQTKRKTQPINASAHLDSLTTMEYAQNVLLEPSGAQPQANASTSAVKIQPTPAQPTPVSAVLDSVFSVDHAKHVHQDISLPMDTVLLAQSTQSSILPPKTVLAFPDSSPINGVSVLENAELTKYTTLPPKPAHALTDWLESMEPVKSAHQDLHQLSMALPAQPARLTRSWSMDNANAIKDMLTILEKFALSAQAFPMDS